ncbi:MAG: hypothetical protein ABII99_02320 [Patescibacteria group bacterium]|nr:hypothetical protein [Patescibacteria group bacterium]
MPNTLSESEQNIMAGQMRREKREREGGSYGGGYGKEMYGGGYGNSYSKDKDDKNNGESKNDEQSQSLRQRVMQARRALNIKKRLKEKAAKKITAPIRKGTNWLLKLSWLNLIDSVGLSLIWINIHVGLNKIFGDKLFVKLGGEWLEEVKAGAGGEGAPAGEAVEQGEKMIRWVEIFVLLFLDVLVVFIILGVLYLLALMAQFISASTWEKVKMLWAHIDMLEPVYDLFH